MTNFQAVQIALYMKLCLLAADLIRSIMSPDSNRDVAAGADHSGGLSGHQSSM